MFFHSSIKIMKFIYFPFVVILLYIMQKKKKNSCKKTPPQTVFTKTNEFEFINGCCFGDFFLLEFN